MKLSVFLSKKYLIVIGLIVLSCISFFVFPHYMTEGFFEGGVGAQGQANAASVGTGSNGRVVVTNGKTVSELGGDVEDVTFFTYKADGAKNGLIKDADTPTNLVDTDLFTQQAAFGATNRLRIPIPKVPADHNKLKAFLTLHPSYKAYNESVGGADNRKNEEDALKGIDGLTHSQLGEDAKTKFEKDNRAKIYKTDLTIYEYNGKNGKIPGGIKVKAVLEDVMKVGTNYQVRGYYFIIADGQGVKLQGSGFDPKTGTFTGDGAAVQYKLRIPKE